MASCAESSVTSDKPAEYQDQTLQIGIVLRVNHAVIEKIHSEQREAILRLVVLVLGFVLQQPMFL